MGYLTHIDHHLHLKSKNLADQGLYSRLCNYALPCWRDAMALAFLMEKGFCVCGLKGGFLCLNAIIALVFSLTYGRLEGRDCFSLMQIAAFRCRLSFLLSAGHL